MTDPEHKTLKQLRDEWVAAINAVHAAEDAYEATAAAYDAFAAYQEALKAQENSND